jgi:hypothetical protein
MCHPCKALTENQQNLGEFVSHESAKAKLNRYLDGAGSIQPPKGDEEHVYGHLFGLNLIKELLMKIDTYNIATVNPTEQITAVRVYRSKSETPEGLLNDVLIVPVRRSGYDYPEPLVEGDGGDIILGNGGPCPNVCNASFFTAMTPGV